MNKTPNSEQNKAIEHNGGVLLRAGAGSGKTFVLIEHFIYLTKKWIAEYKEKTDADFDEFIKNKFSKVVMMTFTKKAAGEMNTRLFERFKNEYLITQDIFWEKVNHALPFLNVVTIDGFCKKLISQGYFSNINPRTEVIFFNHRKFQIKKIIDDYLLRNRQLISKNDADLFFRKKDALIKCFANIFSDPGSRIAWEKFSIKSLDFSSLNLILEESFRLNSLDFFLEEIKQLKIPDFDKERSSFEKNVDMFQSTGLPLITNTDVFGLYRRIFLSLKSLQPERTASKKDSSHIKAHRALVVLKDWITEWAEIVESFEPNFDSRIKPWIELSKNIFDFITLRLNFSDGLTFGDMEYIVFKGLESNEIRKKIAEDYNYFIVDEFQDTSEIQFQIIRYLINNDFNRLFCVGDAKQAIYGFRGGELSVFKRCSELVIQNLSLVNNYRSDKSIIEFNNSLFGTIFPLGKEFKGYDSFTVQHEDQNYPLDLDSLKLGNVTCYECKMTCKSDNEFRPTTDIVNQNEAELIFEIIKDTKIKHVGENICILYQRLGPSFDLIQKLLSFNIGFTAQFKIDPVEDPVIIIFLSLLKRKFDSNVQKRDEYCLFVINVVLSKLDVTSTLSIDLLTRFDKNEEFFGVTKAFHKFISSLNFSVENFDLNLAAIENLFEIFQGNIEEAFINLSSSNSEKLSMEFRSGDHSGDLQIMTAHASKGLEFDSVILGGILTNGKEVFESELVGKIPGSFTWYSDLSQKISFLSPQAQLEKEILSYKSFSESKRLFYVACTRAKKRLFFVDLIFEDKPFKSPKNSWIEGLRVWRDKNHANNFYHLIQSSKNIITTSNASFVVKKLPLYFYDRVGLYQKTGSSLDLGIFPDLSVTRLNSLLDCSRKFYFENILKLSIEERINIFEDEDLSESGILDYSSSERGSSVHAAISQMIAHNLVIPRKFLGTSEEASFRWLGDQFNSLVHDFKFISEKPLKFKFFNYMISGIPDLVLIPIHEGGKVQIWDFKTGRPDEGKLRYYWFQLKVYAYAIYNLGLCSLDQDLELVISLFDIKQNLNLKISYNQIESELYDTWKLQNSPWKINLDHCSQCSYGDICQR